MLKRVLLGAAVLLGPSACLTSYDQTTPSGVVKNDSVTEDPPAVRPVNPVDSTSLWMQYGDPYLLALRASQEGPLEISSQRHSCNKFKFHTLGQVLLDLGVNMQLTRNTATPGTAPSILPLDVSTMIDCTLMVPNAVSTADAMDRAVHESQPARYLYCSSRLTLGLPPYAARLSEATSLTSATVTKLFDTFLAAAAELATTNLANATRCKDAQGNQAKLFNTTDNTCIEAGVACLQGYWPSAEQMNLCNRIVTSAQQTDPVTVTLNSGTKVNEPMITAIDNGKRLAAAAILANAHLCE